MKRPNAGTLREIEVPAVRTMHLARLPLVFVMAVAALSGCAATPSAEAATPTPTAAASESSGQTLTYSAAVQDLEPGTYSIPPGTYSPAKLTFTMPAGWAVQYLGFSKHRDEPNELGVATWIVTHVYTDTCAAEGELLPIGPSVDDLVNALEALGGAAVSPAVETTVDGYPAKRVDLAMAGDIDLADCRVPALQIWANPGETDFYARVPGATDSVYVIDVEGETLAISAGHMPTSSASDVAELDAIISSIQIEAQP
jgi:hypothetical protein